MFGDSGYGVHELELAADDSVVLYTDGLVESTDPSGEEYGISRLSNQLEAWNDLAPAALASTALTATEAYRAGTAADDDQTLLVLRRRSRSSRP